MADDIYLWRGGGNNGFSGYCFAVAPAVCAGVLSFFEVDIIVEGDTLTIRGELRPPLENVEYLFQEWLYGAFSRTLTLNCARGRG